MSDLKSEFSQSQFKILETDVFFRL